MKSFEQLFYLIHSLTPSEKRYLRVEASKQTSEKAPNYMQLLEAIAQMEVYDDGLLKKKFAGAPFLKHLSVAKSYLVQIVLRSLRAYHGGKNIALFFREQLDEIELLAEKGLFDQCQRWIRRNRKKARELDAILVELDLLKYERRTLRWQQEKKLADRWADLDAVESELLAALTLETRLRQINDRYFAYILQGGIRPQLSEILPELPDTLHPNAQFLLLGIKAQEAQIRKDQEGVFAMQQQIFQLWEQHPAKARMEPHLYFKALLDYLDACVEMEKDAEFFKVLQIVRQIKARSGKESARQFQVSFHLELRYYLNRHRWEDASRLASPIDSGLHSNRFFIHPNSALTFSYNLFVAFFLQEKWRAALQWLNRILNTSATNARPDIRQAAHLLNIVVHYELGNYELLASLLRSLKRQFRKDKLAPAQLRFWRDTLEKIADHGPNVPHELWQSLKEQLHAQHTEKLLLGMQELALWLKMKESGIPLSQLIEDEE